METICNLARIEDSDFKKLDRMFDDNWPSPCPYHVTLLDCISLDFNINIHRRSGLVSESCRVLAVIIFFFYAWWVGK